MPGHIHFHTGSLAVSIAFILYATSFLYTEVIRTILLFYLTPIWGFLLARVVLGEIITPIRWLSMALGLAGLLVICGIDAGLPLPQNSGDWMALSAGVLWAGGSLLLLTDRHNQAIDYGLAFFFWSTAGALACGVIPIVFRSRHVTAKIGSDRGITLADTASVVSHCTGEFCHRFWSDPA